LLPGSPPGLSSIPLAGGVSVTAAVDSNLDFNVVLTPEVGLGTSGLSGFARVVVALSPAAVVSDLEELGLSGSFQKGRFSGSVTFPAPGGAPQFDNPIVEVGIGVGGGGLSATAGFGFRLGGSNASANDPAGSATALQSLETSLRSTDFGGASRGPAIFPSMPNLNQIQQVYAK